MCELIKVVDFSVLVELSEDFAAMQTVAVDFICLQNKKIHENRLQSLNEVLARHSDIRKPNPEKGDFRIKSAKELLHVIQSMNKHEEVIMTWLVDYKLEGSSVAPKNEHQRKLVQLCEGDQTMWLREINKSIDNYLQTKKLIDDMTKYIV